VNSIKWRGRLTYLVMSLVVGWHSLAMVVSPSPNGSVLVQSLRSLFHPYLLLFRLETPWGFFAPVGKHAEFRYVIEDAAGNQHIFVPTEEPSPSLARYVWWREFKYLYDGVMAHPEFRGDAAGALLCQRHASLDPRSVTLLEVVEKDYGPEDELRGKRPLDPEFIAVIPQMRVACPNGSALPPRSSIRPFAKPS
jgi:hypothetical protein